MWLLIHALPSTAAQLNRRFSYGRHEYLHKTEYFCSLRAKCPFATWIILDMGSVNENRHYIVIAPLIGWTHIQNNPCVDDDLLLLLLY